MTLSHQSPCWFKSGCWLCWSELVLACLNVSLTAFIDGARFEKYDLRCCQVCAMFGRCHKTMPDMETKLGTICGLSFDLDDGAPHSCR